MKLAGDSTPAVAFCASAISAIVNYASRTIIVSTLKQLIAEVPPKVIHNEKENRYYLAKLEELNNRWTELTQAERDLYDTIGVLIEDFEKRTYKTRAATPIEAIKELMAVNAA